MDVQLKGRPAYTAAYCILAHQESVLVARGGMVMMDGNVVVATDTGGGVLRAAMRKLVGGESFFMGRYTAEQQGAWVLVAPKYPGDITVIDLASLGSELLVESGCLLATSDTAVLDVNFAGVSNIALGEGISFLAASGHGQVLVASYGAIETLYLEAGQSVIVDTGHLVALEASATIRAGLLGGATVSATTGEGVVARISGPGHLWLQTRAEAGLHDWITPRRGHQDQ